MCMSEKRPQPALRRAGLQWAAEAPAPETIIYVKCEKSSAGNFLRHENNLSVYLCQRKALCLSSFLGTYWNVKVLRHKQINKQVNCFPETQFDSKLIQFLRQGWQKINCFVLCLWMPRPEKHVVPWEKAVAPGWEPDRELQDQLCHSLSLGTHWTPQSQFPSL